MGWCARACAKWADTPSSFAPDAPAGRSRFWAAFHCCAVFLLVVYGGVHASRQDFSPLLLFSFTQIFSVIPDPQCAPWDLPRSDDDYQAQEGGGLYGKLRRSPGARRGLTAEAWIAHWQMVRGRGHWRCASATLQDVWKGGAVGLKKRRHLPTFRSTLLIKLTKIRRQMCICTTFLPPSSRSHPQETRQSHTQGRQAVRQAGRGSRHRTRSRSSRHALAEIACTHATKAWGYCCSRIAVPRCLVLRRIRNLNESIVVGNSRKHVQLCLHVYALPQVALHSPLLARAHLFYAGFREEGGSMLVPHRRSSARRKQGRDSAALQVGVSHDGFRT